MTSLSEFTPLVVEDIVTIRARMDADANAGVLPEDDGYLDTIEGGFYWDVTQTLGLEAERLWDFLGTEVVAAMFVTTAWGEFLDEHGAVLDVPRKDEVRATGEVTFTAPIGTDIATGTEVAAVTSDPDADPIEFRTIAAGTVTGTNITLAVEAVEPGTPSNVLTGAVTLLVSPVDDVTAVTNAAPINGGADVEADEAYRDRLLLELSSTTGGGTIADYQRWSLAYPGVGRVTVEPVWAGPTTVRVIITDIANHPVSPTVVSGLQGFLDPVPLHGEGQAPIGHDVTVATPANVNVIVAAVVNFKPGYSLDGAGGTIATRAQITAALADYFALLGPGEDVIRNHAMAQFFRVEGVFNLSSLTLNGAAADIPIAALEVAQLVIPATLS